jgi:hypothetical protein
LHDGKDGRMHLHVVWARTDIDTMKVIPDNLNYVAHERASHRLELEFGHEFVPGKHAKRDRKKQPEFPREKFNQAEAQQAARQEIDPEERKKAITALRQSCDDGQAFRNALEQAGYILARGDRRGLVIVDQDGEVLSLSRQVLDIKGKALKEFMADVDPAVLPRVEEAKALQMQRAKAQEEREREEVRKQPEQTSRFVEPPAPQPSPPPAPELQDAELEALKQALAERQAREIEKWADFHAHELRQKEFELDQDMAQHLGLRDTDDRVALQALKENIRERRTGIKGVIDALENRWNPQLAAERTKARRKEIRDLMRRQERERKDYEALLEQTKQLELDNLKAQHARKMQDLAREQEQERERYIREHHEAKRILAELEEERRKLEEELKHNDSLRDGPPPPKLGK